MTTRYRLLASLVVIAAVAAGCGSGKPDENALRDSFANQLAANKAVKDFQRNGDDMTFAGPAYQGTDAKWRVHIDSAVIETMTDDKTPYKGTVKSSWYADGELVEPRGQRSNLPVELTANGLAQDCWALWDTAARKWGWE